MWNTIISYSKRNLQATLLIAFVINIVFIVTPFMDIFNVFGWIHLASYFGANQPIFKNVSWPGGPFYMLVFVPIYFSYIFSDFNLYVVILVLKLILFLFVILTSMLLYRITKADNPKNAKAVLFFALTSPTILAVCYEFTQFDIVPVFFVLFSYYVFYYKAISKNELINESFGIFLFCIAIFFEYYPLLLIPTLLVYSVNNNARLKRLILLLGEGFGFYLFNMYLFRGSYNYAESFAGGTISNHGLIGLSHYVQLPIFWLYGIIFLVSVIIPVIFKRFRYNQNASYLVVVGIFIYLSPSVLENDFLWLFTFTILLLVDNGGRKISYYTFLLSQLFILVGIIGFNVYDGTGTSQQQGVFYFGYMVFHKNIILLNTQYLYNLFFFWYNLSLILSLVFTFAYTLSKTSKKVLGSKQESIKTLIDNSMKITSPIKRHFKSRSHSNKKQGVVLLSVILILLIISYAFNNVYQEIPNTSSLSNFPTAMLSPGYNGIPGRFAIMNIPNETFQVVGNSVIFEPGASGINMSRDFNNEYFNISFALSIKSAQPGLTPVLKASNVTIGFIRTAALYSSSYSTIPSVYDLNMTRSSLNYTSNLTSFPFDTYQYTGISSSIYHLNSSIIGKTVFLAFKTVQFPKILSIPVYISNSNFLTEFAIKSYNSAMIACYNTSDNRWHSESFSFSNDTLSGYNFLLMTFEHNGISIQINGENYTLLGPSWKENSTLTLGVPWGGAATDYSFQGLMSAPLLVNNFSIRWPTAQVYLTDKNWTKLYNTNDSKATIQISDKQNLTTILVNNDAIKIPEETQDIIFGNFIPGEYVLRIAILSYEVQTSSEIGLYLIPVFFAFVIPYVATSWYFIIRRGGDSGK